MPNSSDSPPGLHRADINQLPRISNLASYVREHHATNNITNISNTASIHANISTANFSKTVKPLSITSNSNSDQITKQVIHKHFYPIASKELFQTIIQNTLVPQSNTGDKSPPVLTQKTTKRRTIRKLVTDKSTIATLISFIFGMMPN